MTSRIDILTESDCRQVLHTCLLAKASLERSFRHIVQLLDPCSGAAAPAWLMRAATGQTLLKLGNSLHQGHRHRGVGQTVPSTRIAGRPAAPACQHFSTGSAAVTHGLLRGLLLPVIAGAGAGVGCGTAAYYYGPGSPKTPAAAALTTAGDAACGSFGGISPNALSVPAWTSHTDVCAADEQSARTGVQLTPAWAQQLAGRQGVLEVLNPETLRTRSHPLLSEDHMVGHVHASTVLLCIYGDVARQTGKLVTKHVALQFSALVRNDMVQSLSCYFEPEHKQFYSVIHLGTDICGYKRIVHGKAPSSLLKLSCLHGRGHLVSHALVHFQVD